MVIMVLLLSFGLRHGQRYIMQAAGMPSLPAGMPGVPGLGAAQFSSEESDLMSTVFKSALRLFSGTAKRDELASELSDKLYAGRAGAGEMSELGIDLVKPGGASAAPPGVESTGNTQPGASANTQPGASASANPQAGAKANAQPGANVNPQSGAKANAQRGAKSPAKQGVPVAGPPAGSPSDQKRTVLLTKIWDRVKPFSIELGLIPVVLLGMVLVNRVRWRRSGADDFMLPLVGMQAPADSETYEMKHAVHSLGNEDFELLVALIYQRQGYRVSMSAALSGGRGGDFTLARKAERVLVQCKKLELKHRIPVERVREFHEAMTTAGMPRGLFVAPCGFTWDARNFAKTRGVTLINAPTLDELIIATRESPDEDLLAVAQWVPKLMSKVKLTPPLCPACEASMDELKVSNGTVWVCSQRPECRGRRCARKHHKTAPAPAQTPATHADEPAERAQSGDRAPTRPARPAAPASARSAEPAAARPTEQAPDPYSAMRAAVAARLSGQAETGRTTARVREEIPAPRDDQPAK